MFKRGLCGVVLLAIGPFLALAQDGSISAPTSSAAAAGYSCDATQCKLPNCNCASTSPPGGLNPSEVPQFIVFTADDAIQSYTLDAVNQFLAQRKNPNGCAPKMTYFTSLNYTNYTLVTDWYVAGNEIADHTMTHVGSPPADEINGNIIALNALAGIPFTEIQGFRAPYLNYTPDTLRLLYEAEFTYDSSSAAAIPVTDPGTDAYWPYTLDYGFANDCIGVPGLCQGQLKLPGFWEMPMYGFFDERGANGVHLMDPWLDTANGASTINNTATLEYMKNTFTAHYTGNRQPVGLYTHPVHLSLTYPGVNPDPNMIAMINAFLDWAQEQQDVWIVSNAQLLSWMRNPVPVSQLGQVAALQCSTPDVSSSLQICNGIPQNENGLLAHCDFSDFPFFTCYGCPQTEPTPSDPNPPQAVVSGQSPRYRLPTNCSTPFWDPIKGDCICTSTTCAFTDTARSIGPNGANLTGGETGSAFNSSGGSSSGSAYVPFNGAAPKFSPGLPASILVGLIGVILGAVGV